MKLSSENAFVAVFRDKYNRYPNDFCELFWFGVSLLLPVFLFLFMMGWFIYRLIVDGWIYLIVIGVSVLLSVLFVWLGKKIRKPKIKGPKMPEVMRASWATLRNKYCTKLEIVEGK